MSIWDFGGEGVTIGIMAIFKSKRSCDIISIISILISRGFPFQGMCYRCLNSPSLEASPFNSPSKWQNGNCPTSPPTPPIYRRGTSWLRWCHHGQCQHRQWWGSSAPPLETDHPKHHEYPAIPSKYPFKISLQISINIHIIFYIYRSPSKKKHTHTHPF